MLTEICQYLKNWFERNKYYGVFEIENGQINVDGLQNGQYFRIIGSLFNDGIHQYPTCELIDETFDGSVWALAIPSAVINLSDEIQKWQTKHGSADSVAMSPFTSESFGGYSYTKSSGGAADGQSGSATWETVYANRLRPWRKL